MENLEIMLRKRIKAGLLNFDHQELLAEQEHLLEEMPHEGFTSNDLHRIYIEVAEGTILARLRDYRINLRAGNLSNLRNYKRDIEKGLFAMEISINMLDEAEEKTESYDTKLASLQRAYLESFQSHQERISSFKKLSMAFEKFMQKYF